MTELEPLYAAFRQIGEDPANILNPDTAHLVAHGQRLISQQAIPGVEIQAQGDAEGIHARVVVAAGRIIPHPVHLCFGLFDRFGAQTVDLEVRIEAGAQAHFWSHCLFTIPELARHAMDARIELLPGSRLRYSEVHYHGQSGGIEVLPKARILVGEGAHYQADFSLVQGRVGRLEIDYEVKVGAQASAELLSRVHGRETDTITLNERVHLDGEGARGLLKTRVAVEDRAQARILGATYGNAAGARGHVDCLEIVRDQASASAVPEVRVTHPGAKVTHEAAIGSVDERQIDALMARGLTPSEAVDLIVLGMLGWTSAG